MKGDAARRAITPQGRGDKSDKAKESMLMTSINQISIDNDARKTNAAKRCLTSQIGDRLRLSVKPAQGEVVYNLKAHQRIAKIKDSIFVDDKETMRINTDRTLNQCMSSTMNPLTMGQRSRSPVFGGGERSVSPNQVQYRYVKYDAAPADPKAAS